MTIKQAIVIGSALWFLVWLMPDQEPQSQQPPRTYVVQAGDTLWSIAKKAYPNTYRWEAIDKICKANSPDGNLNPILYPGQNLILP